MNLSQHRHPVSQRMTHTIRWTQKFCLFRYMFVTDWGEKMKKIERFNMDGSERKVIVKTDINSPYCITVDVATNLVYWGDAGDRSKIESMTVDGTNRKVCSIEGN